MKNVIRCVELAAEKITSIGLTNNQVKKFSLYLFFNVCLFV